MLKHADLTLNRIGAFLFQTLKPAIHPQRHSLKIEVNDAAAVDQLQAEQGPWREVGKGFAYGPAYTTLWFRISGVVPPEFAGHPLAIIPELGGERTVWKDNSPWCGVDVEHSDFGWLTGHSFSAGPESGRSDLAQGGERLSYTIQTYARNAQTTVHGKEAPRTETSETVDYAAVVTVNPEVKALFYDVEFSLGLLQTIAKTDPAYQNILRVLNDIVNNYQANATGAAARDNVARCRKAIRDLHASLGGELKHAIYPVGHAHLDTAWLWPIEITKKKMAHTTSTQLGLMERYPDYVFVHSQASQYEWLEKEYPALFARVQSAVNRGQWEPVGSMWVEADCNLTGGESLVRQFLYGRRYFRQKLGYETEDMWLPDVFGYSAALPQILAKFNIRYFLTQKISWNQFNKFPHHTFWWQGIDGTRVWSHFPPADTYNASAEPKEVTFSVHNYKDHGRADQSLYVYGFGDGGGGPTERHIELLKRGRLAPNYPEVNFGKRAIDFFREAKARSRDLQTWVGELYLELHRGTYTSQAANKKGNRHSEFLLRDAEWLASFSPGFPANYPKAELEAAWKLVLLNQFHDIIPGSSVREVYEDSDRDYAAIKATGDKIIDDCLRQLGAVLDTSAMSRPIALFQNATVPGTVFLPWNEDGPAPQSVKSAEETLPAQVVEVFGEKQLVFTTPLEALGTVAIAELSDTYAPPRSRLKGSVRKLENDEIIVRFDAHGNITSILAQEERTEFVVPGKLANLFQLFEDKPNFWSAWDIDAFALETGVDLIKSESFELVEKGPVRVAVEVVKKFGSSRIRQRISLGSGPGIRFDTDVDWHEEDRLLKVAFPIQVNAARATYEIQFGNVERPTHMNTSWEMAKFEVCAHKWVDLSEADLGVALINESKYGFDVRGNVIRMSLLRSPKAPDPLCDMGTHRFSYMLLPHFAPFRHADVVAQAYAFNAPVRFAHLEPHPGEVAALPPFISCENRNLVIETVKKAEDSNDLIVRLYECHNTRGRAEVHCAIPPKFAYLCDLEENVIDEIEVHGRVIPIDFKPFEIITLKIQA
jgi:alpha-mannosidase